MEASRSICDDVELFVTIVPDVLLSEDFTVSHAQGSSKYTYIMWILAAYKIWKKIEHIWSGSEVYIFDEQLVYYSKIWSFFLKKHENQAKYNVFLIMF